MSTRKQTQYIGDGPCTICGAAERTTVWSVCIDCHTRAVLKQSQARPWNHASPWNHVEHALVLARQRAEAAGREFRLTLADLLPLPTHCPILKLPLDYGVEGAGRSPTIWCAPDEGCTPGNVAIISNRASALIKSSDDADEHRAVADWLDYGVVTR